MHLRKIKKLLNKPHIFFRDYLIKKYPIYLNKNNIQQNSENLLISTELELYKSFSPDFPIDIVFTWVDNKDSSWVLKFNNYKNVKNKSTSLFALDSTRFTNHNEIFYSVYSVIKYMPWVNNIYIITDKQIPNIPITKKNIFIIDHEDIIPKEFLPTFNSHVIEAYIHKIPNLSENFIYFNDDFFVARPLPPEHFFKGNNIASLFTSNINKNLDIMTATSQATNNVNKLFKKQFNTFFNRPLTHTYVPLKKSIYTKAHELFKSEIHQFSTNKFRSDNDLNMATFLVPYMQYLEKLAYPCLDICIYFNIRSPNALTAYNYLSNQKIYNNSPHSFCANDFFDSKNNLNEEKVYKDLNTFLIKYYEISADSPP